MSLAALRTWRPTPKHLISVLITLILVLGEWRYGIVGGYGKLALTLGTCVAVEWALSLFLLGRRPMLLSAYITGISLTMLVRPQAAILWPFVVGAALSIGSKYVLRFRGGHLWNPSNLGLSVLLLLAPSQVAILSHEFGNDLRVNAVIWVIGLLVASRARILHVTASYVVAFTALAALRSQIAGTPLGSEIAPLTGPMYQLLVFFMLTDPATSVRSKKGRIATAVVIALVEAALRLGNDLHFTGALPFGHAPAIFALFLVGPAALLLERSLAPRPEPARQRALSPAAR